jgi:NADH-quinone oxidoreductase subunit I
MALASTTGYFKQIADVSKTIVKGMGITLRYFRKQKETCITLQYPREQEKLPPRHRGIHFLETEKCIMCFICARACPVDCITIEGSRDGGVTGSHKGDKAWLTRFTIDYGKCIFCNLCCEPCPTDCIHMGQEFDFSCYNRSTLEKNLLTNRPFTQADLEYVRAARPQIDKLAEEKARQKAEAAARKKAEAAKKAAEAAKPAAPAPPGSAGEGSASAAPPATKPAEAAKPASPAPATKAPEAAKPSAPAPAAPSAEPRTPPSGEEKEQG